MLRASSELKYFVKNLPRNLRVMIFRTSVANFVQSLNPYNSLYIILLGATATQLGLLSSIGLALSSIFAIIAGNISDRGNRKKIYLIGAFIGLFVPLSFAIAPSWIWLAPAFLIYGFSDGFIFPSLEAMYANSVKNKNRGKIYGLANIFILSPILFAGIIGGWIVSNNGGLTVEGIKPIYWVQMILLTASFLIVMRYLDIRSNGNTHSSISLRGMLSDYRDVLMQEGVSSWVLMKSLGSISVGMAGPYWMVYAAMVHRASVMTIAYMVTARSLTQFLLSPISGNLVDILGRKKMIISGRIIMYLGTAIFLLNRTPLSLIISWILMGINDSTNIAWSAEEAELVPPSQRSRITAVSHGAFNVLAIPASIFGGYLYDFVNPSLPFIVMAIIDGLIRMPIIHLLVPESSSINHIEIEELTAFSMEASPEGKLDRR